MKKLLGLMIVACFVLAGCDMMKSTSDAARPGTKADALGVEGGMNAYLKASKEMEARQNLKAIADAAVAYYESEHTDNGEQFYSRVYPRSRAVQIGPKVDESTINKQYTPSESDYDKIWRTLMFHISTPSYYTYYYISDGKTFKAKAAASLAGACDSILMVQGDSSGVVGVVDVTGSGDCNPLTLP